METKESIQIAVDTGAAFTKYAWLVGNEIASIKASSFPTRIKKMGENSDFYNGIKIKYNGDFYDISEESPLRLSRETKKVGKEVYEICVYVAIAKALQEIGADPQEVHPIELSINIPVSDFKQQNVKSEYIAQYKGKKTIIEVDGTEYTFAVEEVVPYFESQGVIMRTPEKFAQEVAFVFDLGGRNDTICKFRNLKPDGDSALSGQQGLLSLLDSVAGALQAQNDGDSINANEVFKAKTGLRRGKLKGFEEQFAKATENYFQNIDNRLTVNGFRPADDLLVFTGGGAVLLKNELEAYFSKVVSSKDQLIVNANDGWADNCKGALKRALIRRDAG